MSRISEKEQLLKIVIEDAADRIMWIDDMQNSDDEDEVMEILEELNEDLLIIYACNRGMVSSKVQNSMESSEDILSNMNDETFQQMLRVDRMQFKHLVSLIQDDIVFNKKHSNNQLSIELQLAVVLYRLGLCRKDSIVRHIANIFKIGYGGTLAKFTERVFTVILKLAPKYLHWPNSARRAQIVAATYHELPHCIGYVDEVEIKRTDPQENFVIKAQIVCDYKMRIRNLKIRKVDVEEKIKVFQNAAMQENKEKFFETNQWLAGDAAYQLSDIVVTPYNDNCEELTETQRNAFNERHNKYRVRIEHCLGLLRKKFASLNELRVRGNKDKSYKFRCTWIRVCCVLHNILLKDDEIEDIGDNDSALHKNVVEYNSCIDDVPMNGSFEAKRQSIFNLMFKS